MAKQSELVQGLIDKGAATKDFDDQPDIQTVSETDLGRVAAEEAFMHEQVKVLIHPSSDPNAPPYAHLSVNGDNAIIFRNVPTVIRRKHLEVLARMKETRVSQDLTPNTQGEITMVGSVRGHTALAYPFLVLEDKNPKGAAWLANVLAERG